MSNFIASERIKTSWLRKSSKQTWKFRVSSLSKEVAQHPTKGHRNNILIQSQKKLKFSTKEFKTMKVKGQKAIRSVV